MDIIEFKSALKSIKNNLKGLTIQFRQPKSVMPFNSLNEFGHAVLSAETNCNTFYPTQVWTSTGIEYVKSFQHLVELFKVAKIEAVSFTASYVVTDFAESMRLGGGLD